MATPKQRAMKYSEGYKILQETEISELKIDENFTQVKLGFVYDFFFVLCQQHVYSALLCWDVGKLCCIFCLCMRSFTSYPPGNVQGLQPINVCLIGKFYVQKVALPAEHELKVDKLGGCTVNWAKHGGLEEAWNVARRAAGWF